MASAVEICPTLTDFFKKFYIHDFFDRSTHGFHLCDKFGGFNINIEDFIGKNNEKITKNYPYVFYIKVKILKNWISNIFGMELNFDIP